MVRCLTFGLYSAFRACKAIVLRSSRHSRFTVATMFLGGEREVGVGGVGVGVGVGIGGHHHNYGWRRQLTVV